MYTSFRRYQVDPSNVDEIIRRVNEGFVPIVSSVAGFIAYQCIDAGGGVVATISVFEDKAGAEELTQKAADWVRENLASLVSNPPEITAGEVKLHKMA